MKVAARLLICVIGLMLGGTVYGFSKDIYVAQNTAGANSGSDCGDAHSAAWFNTAANWGSGGSQISPGDTAHLCGIFSSALTTQAAGTSGNVTTITFESGAGMSAGFWGPGTGAFPASGALNITESYIHVTSTVPGVGTQGSIVATLSGASGTTCPGGTCTTDKATAGVVVSPKLTNVEVDHLTISNIYLCNGATACNTSWYTAGIFIGTSASETNLSVHDNTIDGVGTEIFLEYSGAALSNVNIYNNNLGASHGGYWGIVIGSGSSGNTTSNVNIYGNTIAGCSDWSNDYNNGGTGEGYHCDGVIVYSTSSSNLFNIYNNSINFTGPLTGDIFCTYGSSSTGASCNIFNNVLQVSNSTCAGVGGGRAVWIHSGAGTQQIFNNTLIGNNSSCYLMEVESGASVSKFENNILTAEKWGIENPSTGNLTTVDYNLYNTSSAVWNYNGTYETFSAWEGLGFDTHGVSANPNSISNGTLQAGSAAIAAAANLYSTCNGQANPGLGALCKDKNGVSRPATGAWDAGATQYSSQTQSSPVAPPGGVTAIVH